MRTNQKRIRFWPIFIAATVCAIFLVLFLTRSPREPSYGGKDLHVWLGEIDRLVFRVTTGKGMKLETTNAAINAIVSMGSDATPWLRQELRMRDPWLQKIVYRLPTRFRPDWLERQVASPDNPSLWTRQRRAAMAVLILGADAKSLAPELADLMHSEKAGSPFSFALARMGQDGVLPLARALTNSSMEFDALAALAYTDASTEAAVPALLCVLTNGGGFPSIQDAFVNARGAAQVAVPILQAAISHTNWVVSQSAESALHVLQTRVTRRGEKSFLIRVDWNGNWGTLW